MNPPLLRNIDAKKVLGANHSVAVPLGHGIGTRAVPKDYGMASSRPLTALLTENSRCIFSFSYQTTVIRKKVALLGPFVLKLSDRDTQIIF